MGALHWGAAAEVNTFVELKQMLSGSTRLQPKRAKLLIHVLLDRAVTIYMYMYQYVAILQY